MTYQNSLLFFILMHLACFGTSQTELKKAQAHVFERLSDFESDSNLISIDSNIIIWNQIDTFHFVRYTSAIRSSPKHDTLQISLRFESGWSETVLNETKQTNTELISKLKKTYIEYMDSINWRGYKISRSSFAYNPVMHLKMVYPVRFNKEERAEIKAITRCPDFFVGNIGVFIECSHTGIDPIEVQDEFLEKLRFISQDTFESEEVNYGAKYTYE